MILKLLQIFYTKDKHQYIAHIDMYDGIRFISLAPYGLELSSTHY